MELMAIQINYNATVLSRFVQSNVSKIIRSVLVLQNGLICVYCLILFTSAVQRPK